jgi:mannose-1-phosphate guanylyltransferase/mannose-6-phosphate isomerase
MSAVKKDATGICAVVLAGGSGTRLWPLSRGEFPKQLVKLTGEHSLLQDTVLRLDGLSDEEKSPLLLVVCHEEQRFLIRDQLEEIDRSPERILLEPESRNTAPALCSAAHFLKRKGGDPVMIVLPADHVILDAEGFRGALKAAVEIANAGFIVTLGVVPTRPDTGYGYIRRDTTTHVRVGADSRGHRIAAFVEKPGQRAAESYLASGQYFWNSGVFILRASIWLEAIDRCRPELLEACRNAVKSGRDDDQFFHLGREAYAPCPSDSIDYAVMERLSKSYLRPADDGREGEPIPAAVVSLDAGWSDVGTWSALLEQRREGDHGNSFQGDVVAMNTSNSLLISTGRLVAAYGLDEIVVVETPDAVLVMDKNQPQGVREIVDQLNSGKRDEARTHRLVHRPWGSFESLESRERFQVKRLTVKPGAKLSLQLHHHRAEHWVVVKGVAKVTRGEDVFELNPNESTYIPVKTKHRLENPGKSLLEVIEVQVGDYLGEDDIERFEDVYKRVESSN